MIWALAKNIEIGGYKVKWFSVAFLLLIFFVSESHADKLKERLNSFSYQSQAGTTKLRPTLDIKAEILRKFPTIAIDAKKIIDRQGVIAETTNDFHDLIYYFFLLDDHKNILNLLSNPISGYRRYGTLPSDYLDIIYLLPAILHERIGNYNLSNIYYHRYFSGMKVVLSKGSRFSSREFALKMTLTRLKIMVLNRKWRPPNKSYYKVSYFSFQQDSLFSMYTRNRKFLKKYQDREIFRKIPLKIDYERVQKIIEQSNEKVDLFDLYELCSMALYIPLDPYQTPTISKEQSQDMKKKGVKACGNIALVGVNSTHPVYTLYNFTMARISEEYGDYDKAFEYYRNVISKATKETEFLKDDAEFHQAVLYSKQGLDSKYKEKLEYIVANYSNDYDAVAHAKELIEWIPSGK